MVGTIDEAVEAAKGEAGARDQGTQKDEKPKAAAQIEEKPKAGSSDDQRSKGEQKESKDGEADRGERTK